VRLQQLPQEYLDLFMELLVLSMQPNAGVRGSAVPTLLACLKRFPCLVELLVPEVLAALAGVPGPVLGAAAGGGKAAGLGGSSLPAAAGVGGGAAVHSAQLPQQEDLEKFYGTVLLDAMQNQQQVDASASTAAAAAAAAGASADPEAAAVTAMMMAAKAAKAAAGGSSASAAGNGNGSTAVAAKAAAAAYAAATAGRSSVAQESANDGRVAGACTVLTGCLDAWRVIFRDGLVFRGFLYALMASRCHTSNTCLKSIQMLIMQVRGGDCVHCLCLLLIDCTGHATSDHIRRMQLCSSLLAVALKYQLASRMYVYVCMLVLLAVRTSTLLQCY
jgi:hypothetical protein